MTLERIRVELTVEQDLWFQFSHDVDLRSFAVMISKQKINLSLPEYPDHWKAMADATLLNPEVIFDLSLSYMCA